MARAGDLGWGPAFQFPSSRLVATQILVATQSCGALLRDEDCSGHFRTYYVVIRSQLITVPATNEPPLASWGGVCF